jgi:two-component system response regulator TctD
MKLLLVEDDPSMQTRAAAHPLRTAGMDVECAVTAPRRWRAGRRPPPDVVMLDLSLPGLDGLQVLAQAAPKGCAPRC